MTNLIILIVSAAIVFIGLLYGLKKLLSFSTWTLIIGTVGAVLGLLVGALSSIPLSRLPGVYGEYLPIIITFAAILGAVGLLVGKREPIIKAASYVLPKKVHPAGEILVDTSVFIDGRVVDIAKSGFIQGIIIVPRFILDELQQIADSSNSDRRNKGRRGLESLERLKKETPLKVEIKEADLKDKVDSALVKFAKKRNASLLTTDYNLNRVATIEGVRVLNINELANAIRPVFLPGDDILVNVVQPGKEKSQGVGYLPDGTMIVVEGGDKLMGQEVEANVTRVLQTVAGKMVFVKPKK